MIQHLGAYKDGIDVYSNNPSFRQKAINTLELYITVTHDRQMAKIDCAIGSDFIDLCEEEAKATEDPNGNVCITNASRRRYTGRTPVPLARQRAPIRG